MPQIQFIDRVLACSSSTETGTHSANCAALRRDSTGAALGPVRHARFCATPGVCVAQKQFPMVLTFQKTIEILQLQFIDKEFDVSVVQVQQFSGAVGEETVKLHSCSSLNLDTVVHMPVAVQRQLLGGSDVRKL